MNLQQKRYIQNFWGQVKAASEVMRKEPMPELREEDFFLFKKTGNRLIYEGEYFGRRKYLTVFGMLAEFEQKQEDIDKLAEIIMELCEERFWALPAHVNFDTLDETTIDLFAAETAGTLAEMLWMFQEKLSKDVVEKASQEIVRRVLLPFSEKRPIYSWWEQSDCNWSAVCAGNVGIAAIYMDWLQVPELVQLPSDWKENCLNRVCDAMQCYLDGMEEDGACTEGLGYFSYGMSYYTAFAELLEKDKKRCKNSSYENLMKRPKCDKVAAFQQKCYFGKGVSLSFSDGAIDEHFLPGLTTYLQYCYEGIEVPDYSLARDLEEDHCYRWVTNERNLRWLLQYGAQVQNEEEVRNRLQEILQEDLTDVSENSDVLDEKCTYDLLPSAQWMIAKDRYGNGFAAKGGHNAENHNHNDVGHFLCVYEGEMLLSDLGAGEYTKDYFSDGRYGILCNRSLGHSVPFINGQEQQEGKEYRADYFAWNERRKELTISFAGAYENTGVDGCLDQLERTIRMEEAEAQELRLQVKDLFITTEKTESIVENLITTYQPVVDEDGVVTIQGQHGRCQITMCVEEKDAKNLGCNKTIRGENIRMIPQQHNLHNGEEITVYLIQWDVLCKKDVKYPQESAVYISSMYIMCDMCK